MMTKVGYRRSSLIIHHSSFDSSLDRFKRELLRWNERINLIGPEATAHLDDHVAEALAAAEILKPRGNVLDFGSGGGLPAIPMAIVSPEAKFYLVEADQKKWAFLKHVVRECGLSGVVVGDRLSRALERFPPDLRFSLVTSRAVGKAEEWVPPLREWLEPGGRVALFQGTDDVPAIAGIGRTEVHRLPRGGSNFLVVMTFHVKQ
jgi:16S rRNA (guanine527-N7)-methyltransferase